MGSTGKTSSSSSTTYSTRNTNDVSDVDKKHTPMSDEDAKRLSSNYFQTARSWTINAALREIDGVATNEAISNAFDSTIPFWLDTPKSRNELIETIKTLDRNMKPINKDMPISRLADFDFLKAIAGGIVDMNTLGDVYTGLSDGQISEIRDALVGAKIFEKGFVSTTYDTSLSDSAFKSRPVRINSTLRQGIKGVFSPTGYESEFVLARGSGYEIRGVSYDNKAHQLVLDVDVFQ